jgi:hypothetical protein
MTCIGWLPVEFYIDGQLTNQALYICSNIDRVYFSRAGCKAVGILLESYPFPMSTEPSERVESIATPPDKKHVPRTVPPAKPTRLPFPPTEENIPRLKQYILDKFETSAFNSSAPFPCMPGPPAHIHLQEGAVPKARHSPIPVPFHLKQKTK